MEDFFEEVQEDIQEDIQEYVQEDYFEVNDSVENEKLEEETKTDTGFTSKDVVDIIKAITGEKTSDSGNENIDYEEEVSSGDFEPVNEDEVIEDSQEIITYDYTELLEKIRDEISSGNAEITEQNYILGKLYDDSKPDSPIDNLSVTNLLLVCIFVLLLVDLLFKIIRGLF